MSDMRHTFTDRADLIAYLRAEFPNATEPDVPTGYARGGRAAAEAALAAVDPARYGATRNFLDGAVTRLAPYIRHGVLTLAEVRDATMQQAHAHQETAKLISELGWRDYFQRIYAEIGDRIWHDREPARTGFAPHVYRDAVPDEVLSGTTTLVCMDEISGDLRRTGYLHNHQRLWMAAYLIHWRHVRWQAAARWFLQHLLCGDPASNNLSFQWVASTFAAKPYIFNREALEKFTRGVYCRRCPHYRNDCPFEGTYEELTARLFPHAPDLQEGGQSGQSGQGRGGGNSGRHEPQRHANRGDSGGGKHSGEQRSRRDDREERTR